MPNIEFYKAISTKTNEEAQGCLINVKGRHFIVSPFDDPENIKPICVFADSIKATNQQSRLLDEVKRLRDDLSNLSNHYEVLDGSYIIQKYNLDPLIDELTQIINAQP
jgi:hypothetical protein